MNRLLLLPLLLPLFLPLSGFSQTETLYDDRSVGSIHLDLPADSLDYMIDHVVNDHYFSARFIFENGVGQRDTLHNVGLRLRGNTSLGAQKKSFKISFNEFVPGREYQGVRKLNLRGSHNDPTLIREKLFYDVWQEAGMPERRAAFVRLYVNNEYRGVYTNIEEIDKQWLDRTYGDDEGNLYKCTWPASLAYLGTDPAPYQAVLNNPETRAYDLVTNESADDYSRFVGLVTALNQPVNATFPAAIEAWLEVGTVLKAFAIDIATGNWDDYFYNQNNYYLYDNPTTGRFEYVTFDTDNTFGVDWLGKDWAKRNCLTWQASGSRPLATQLLAVPAYRQQFVEFLDTLARFIIEPDSIFPRIDTLHARIAPAAESDEYRTLDYGYSIADFHDGFTETIDGHTPYGIKPFLALRRDSILSQISGLLTTSTPLIPTSYWKVFPNPASDWLYIQPVQPASEAVASLYDVLGRRVLTQPVLPGNGPVKVPLNGLAEGRYLLQVSDAGIRQSLIFVKKQ